VLPYNWVWLGQYQHPQVGSVARADVSAGWRSRGSSSAIRLEQLQRTLT